MAKHTEDTAWVDQYPGWEPFIVEKGIHLPNIGRESSSYFWAITELYDRIDDSSRVVFLQGWPFHHIDATHLNFMGNDDIPSGCHLIGSLNTSDGRGQPHHPNLDVKGAYEQFVGGEFPGSVTFSIGAQFVVSGDRILRRPRGEYRRLIQAVHEFEKGPWAMERLWQSFFGG